QALRLDDGVEVPILGLAGRSAAPPEVVALGALDLTGEGLDPLHLLPHPSQFHGEVPPDPALLKETWNEIISRRVFGQERPPRWVLLLSDRQLLLIDRFKWNQNRLLRFDWEEILGRREDATLKATAVLLHRGSLVPEEGQSLVDTLDENAHRHAFAVSEDLKYALQEAIERLGNEAARQLIQRAAEQKKGIYSGAGELDADQLTLECLRFMYRLLFLFYIEARPELGYVPINTSDVYATGYSLESLRDLELVRLTTAEARDGTYLHTSLTRLFRLIHQGYSGHSGTDRLALEGTIHDTFHIQGLDSHLFDPSYTPLLNRVRFRNDTLQQVIRLMSLTREGASRRRGRVSYAQLGINQLGAVYEALLSYRGFFASEDLYEVKRAGTNPDTLETGYFVAGSALADYREEERVYDRDPHGDRRLRVYPKGRFIYRLAGRDRQKRASYYTPESLTRTLVKYALKELLEGRSADQILAITVCEPAMGSAAFLNEAVNQLAEAYLTRKQAELGRRIPHEDYAQELQRVKMRIVDRNVFGVDLNPVAVELAEVSLWLNAIHGGVQVPWFGYQLFTGNSLVGARRQVYGGHLLGQRPKGRAWYDEAPVRLEPTNPHRQPEQVYHFLLPDLGMAGYSDKTAKTLLPDAFRAMRDWRRGFCQPFNTEDIATLQFLSERVDALWAEHTRELAQDRARTEDPLPVWGQPEEPGYQRSTVPEKDRIRGEGVFNLGSKYASAYRRLKLAMDYWCALWFWPLDRAADLPSREQFLMELSLLLAGDVRDTKPEQRPLDLEVEPVENRRQTYVADAAQGAFPGSQTLLDLRLPELRAPSVIDTKGQLHIEQLLERFPRLALVDELSQRHRFFHWELSFADVFFHPVDLPSPASGSGAGGEGRARGGFDLVLGNPPWIKVEWEEGGVLGDHNPLFILRGHSASTLARMRVDAFERNAGLRDAWLEELEQAEATQEFLNATQNYRLLKGVQSNLYKCFLPQAWMLGSERGVAGFLHPEGVYDDPKGGAFRAELYPRLRAHFQFQNEFQLFEGTNDHGRMRFGLHIYGMPRATGVAFTHMSNLFSPATVNACFAHDGRGPVPGIKDDSNNWNTIGHAHRIIEVDEEALATFAKLYDEPGTPTRQARLPALHARELLAV
ncbi:MAG: N-6 DNA methylase, partial [Gammaproteobacteria bacterium]